MACSTLTHCTHAQAYVQNLGLQVHSISPSLGLLLRGKEYVASIASLLSLYCLATLLFYFFYYFPLEENR